MYNFFSTLGRVLYAAAVAAFGILCLVYVEFIKSLQPVPSSLPGHDVVALLCGIVLLLAGIGLLLNLRPVTAALTLAGVWTLGIVVLLIPSAFTNPELLRSPWWIRTFETLGLAGAAVMVAGLASVPIRESWIRTGRIALGISLPVFGVLHFVYPASVAALVALSPVGYPWPMFWAYLTGTGHFLAGVAIASGVLARPAAVLAGFMYGSWALTLHLPRIVDHPATYSGNRGELTSLSVCVAFWGSAWLVAGAMEALPADRRKARASPDG
jgi:uncharacterized membrane protein YphA (DoxX/SURF4 family)